ncbi:MAG: 50S ribosomal protein L24 [Parcubacteria group bacterium SW_4_49_11]|nr:MAG: 50S ribosomal protein L24 [Parcubacteria group bacterium SW_4_49_11]
MKIKKNDTVRVIAGKDKGKEGRVVEVSPSEGKVRVDGVNVVKKHARAQQMGQKGQIVEKPSFIPLSNVMLMCPHTNQPTRVGYTFVDGKKVRVSKKSNKEV